MASKIFFSHQKVYFWISAFDHRAIVLPKMHTCNVPHSHKGQLGISQWYCFSGAPPGIHCHIRDTRAVHAMSRVLKGCQRRKTNCEEQQPESVRRRWRPVWFCNLQIALCPWKAWRCSWPASLRGSSPWSCVPPTRPLSQTPVRCCRTAIKQ